MKTAFFDYNLFFKFIKTFIPGGFRGIDPDHELMIKLENVTGFNDQCFIAADIIQWQILFTSKRSARMFGIESSEFNPYHLMEATHPDDVLRHGKMRAKLFNLSGKLLSEEKGNEIVSTNLKMRNPTGDYSNILFQSYLFYSAIPRKTVYLVQIHTNIDKFRMVKNGVHYYAGNDLSYFRYPNEQVLNTGSILTKRELEIIKLIESGLYTEQIAEKLFLSPFTISTHRGNILKKTGKASMPELIYQLMGVGLL